MSREFNCKGCLAETCVGCSEEGIARAAAYENAKALNPFETSLTTDKGERIPVVVTPTADGGVHVEEKSLHIRRMTPFSEVPPMVFDKDQQDLIKATVAKNCTDTEFKLLMYLASRYHLDPIRKQIWAVKYGDSPASIFTGRDGFLEIAHRSGHFDGMATTVEYPDEKTGKPIAATCTIWRNDMTHPFVSRVLFSEYTTGQNLWAKKPSVMIIKVAESVCLRKAFSISGLYAPEEMNEGS